MIIKKTDMKVEVRDKMRGGAGEIEITHLVEKDALKHARLLASINIPVGGSIGEHEHNDEVEYYIILKGKGIVCDDGVDKEVNAGDVVVTADGASHNIRNTGDVVLEMIAVIITY